MRKSVFVFVCVATFLPILGARAAAPNQQAASSATSKPPTTTHLTAATAKKTTTTRKRHRATVTKFVPKQKVPTSDRITEIQTALAHGGYYQGDPNGKWDSGTVAAMQKFQSSNGIDPTGKIDAPSLQKLGLGSDIAGVSAPRPPQPAGGSPASTAPAAAPPAASSSSSAATAAALSPTAGLTGKAPQK